MSVLLLLALGLFLGGTAHSQITELIRLGEFEEAYRAAADLPHAESAILAARAAGYRATYVSPDDEDARRWLLLAHDAAQRAIDLAPQRAEAYLELARAEGLLAQSAGILENLDRAPRLRELFERTLELDPQNADAMVALARWHLELSERGVAWLYGASRGRVLPLVEEAVELAPERVGLRVEYGEILLRLGRREDGIEQLRLALSFPPDSAVDGFERQRARRLLGEADGRE